MNAKPLSTDERFAQAVMLLAHVYGFFEARSESLTPDEKKIQQAIGDFIEEESRSHHT